VDLDNGVVDVDHHLARASGLTDQWCLGGEPGQEPRGHRIELTDVAEGERAQERTQRGRCVGVGEDPAHPTVTQHSHVIDAVGARDHPGDQRGDLQARIRALVGRHTQMPTGQFLKSCGPGQRQHRNQPGRGHQIRIIEHRRGRARRVAKLHLRDALRTGAN
jgi:hypothetical protein